MVNLDAAPPMPPSKSAGLGWSEPQDGGMGPAASTPQVRTIAALQGIRTNSQVLMQEYPELAAPIKAFIDQLEQIVPQAMAAKSAMASPSAVPSM